MPAFLGIVLFMIGVLLAIWATERLLEGLVGLSVVMWQPANEKVLRPRISTL